MNILKVGTIQNDARDKVTTTEVVFKVAAVIGGVVFIIWIVIATVERAIGVDKCHKLAKMGRIYWNNYVISKENWLNLMN